jgi:hypothetical protein
MLWFLNLMKVLLFKKKSENIVEELKGEAQLEKQV